MQQHGGSREYHISQVRDRQDDITYMYNLKNNTKVISKTETDIDNKLRVTKGKRMKRELRSWGLADTNNYI